MHTDKKSLISTLGTRQAAEKLVPRGKVCGQAIGVMAGEVWERCSKWKRSSRAPDTAACWCVSGLGSAVSIGEAASVPKSGPSHSTSTRDGV